MNEDSQWNSGRNQNSGSNYSGRKQSGQKYSENRGKNYSPSTSYNYGRSQNGHGWGQGQGYQQHPRRRIDRYKRESINFNDRLIKQNDIIIKLLKEIRDRLMGSTQIPRDNDKGSNKIESPEHVSESSNTISVSKNDSSKVAEGEKESHTESSKPDLSTDQSTATESDEKIADNSAK